MSPDITVHHFTAGSSTLGPIRILEDARTLVNAATAISSQWHPVVLAQVSAANCFFPTVTKPCFVWAMPPPLVDRNAFLRSREPKLRDWDDPTEEEQEEIDVSLLPQFEPTDFSEALVLPQPRVSKRRSRSRSPRRHFADAVNTNLSSQSDKRRCIGSQILSSQTTAISISTLIPFPHYYESPDPPFPPPPGIAKIPAFRIARTLSPSDPLISLFKRTAWLVPLRGRPPFEDASPAQICYTIPSDEPPVEGKLPQIIHWTSAAVAQFWTFLLRQRSMNNFGPISLAYMFSPHRSQRSRRGGKEVNAGRQKVEGAVQKGRHTKRTEGSNGEGRLPVWEYIKIYHDSQYAMKLRSLLDSFRWEPDSGGRIETVDRVAPRYKNRVLKAARLVLVDEAGEAVLLA